MSEEFDCCECGRHIIRFIPEPPGLVKLCAQCITLPGWFNDPELVAILDPEMPLGGFYDGTTSNAG